MVPSFRTLSRRLRSTVRRHKFNKDSLHRAAVPPLASHQTERSGGALHLVRRVWVVHCVSSSLLGPAVPSFRALSGRFTFTVRRHKFNKYSVPSRGGSSVLLACTASHGPQLATPLHSPAPPHSYHHGGHASPMHRPFEHRTPDHGVCCVVGFKPRRTFG